MEFHESGPTETLGPSISNSSRSIILIRVASALYGVNIKDIEVAKKLILGNFTVKCTSSLVTI